jgi:hypothetical protein
MDTKLPSHTMLKLLIIETPELPLADPKYQIFDIVFVSLIQYLTP